MLDARRPPRSKSSQNSTKNMLHGRHFCAIIRIGYITDLVANGCTHAQPPTNTQSPIPNLHSPVSNLHSPSSNFQSPFSIFHPPQPTVHQHLTQHATRNTQHVPGKGVDNCFQETQGGSTLYPRPLCASQRLLCATLCNHTTSHAPRSPSQSPPSFPFSILSSPLSNSPSPSLPSPSSHAILKPARESALSNGGV